MALTPVAVPATNTAAAKAVASVAGAMPWWEAIDYYVERVLVEQERLSLYVSTTIFQ